jgi:Rhodopirellula transposase DDE domain
VPSLLEVVEPHTAGDPMGKAKWLHCRLNDVRMRLAELGHGVSCPVISRLLKGAGYRLRLNVKEHEGEPHPERDQQLEYIREQRKLHQQAGQPTIRVDTKKKELVGNFKNAGRIGCQKAEAVNIHDFLSEGVGRAVPYGIYDLQHNRGTVYVGQSADTPSFPGATHLFIEADGGGSNSSHSRVFKQQLQEKLADGLGLTVTICHYPPGNSKWNPIEHRLFSEISKTWAGCPLRSFDVVLDYINDTQTQTGLTAQAHLVTTPYPTGVKVPDEVMETLNIQTQAACPPWNYTIRPRTVPLS